MRYRTVTPALPTSRADWALLASGVWTVLRRPPYAGFAAVIALVSLGVFVFSRNVGLLLDVVVFGDLSLVSKLGIVVAMYAGVVTVAEPLASATLVTIAVLVGVNVSMLAYYVRTQDLTLRRGSGSLGGLVLGTLGAGCASCGSAVLAGVFSLVGGASAASLLPLDGLEFSLLAIPLILVSSYWIAHGLRSDLGTPS